MADSEKKYIVFAGVNGVGKSTLYYLHPELQNIARVNMDEIVKNIGSWRDISNVLEAGKIAVKLKDQYLKEGISFNQETTLCGHDPINTIRIAKELGYRVEMHYVGVNSPEICKARIKKRIEEGGHGVSEKVVDRRYKASFENLKKAILLCDRIMFYDNTNEMTLFCIYDNKKIRYLTEHVPKWFSEYVQ